jgi:23S rRNA G2445 N2-methylase RlmL
MSARSAAGPAAAGPDPALAPSPGRIKRQVQGREWRFAIVCPPGFEAVCLDEARALGLALAPLPGESAVQPGPVLEWTGRLEDLYRAALGLRAASRLLVRLGGFRAGAREELFRHCQDFPWELWLPEGAGLRIDAHVRHSRISHEGMTAQTVFEAITRRFGRAGLAPPLLQGSQSAEGDDEVEGGGASASDQRLIIHLSDNHATLSLDACGEHLHRRGWRTVQGAAPIRENLAAALLLWAGWPERHRQGPAACLVDGMSGSGSFAVEAAALAMGRPAAGRAGRAYAFARWPSFQAARWHWLESRAWAGTRGDGADPASWRILANELEPAMVSLAQANLARWAGGASPADAAPPVEWRNGDFFELVPPAGSGLLVLNPPYGLRLSDGEGSLYPRLDRHLAERWPAWTTLLLGLPETRLPALQPRLEAGCRFRHGGLTIAAWLFGAGR